MSKRMLMILFSIFCIVSMSFALGTTAGTVVTNVGLLESGATNIYSTNLLPPVGSVYGLSAIDAPTNAMGNALLPVRIYIYFTNNANDADSNAQILLASFSNQPGYTGSAWNNYLEVNGTNVGSNYAIPFVNFGEGAVFQAVLVVYIPTDAPIGSIGYYTIRAITVSNSNHVAARYIGYNGIGYGGVAQYDHHLQIVVGATTSISNIYASDTIDTIYIFDGSTYLRKLDNYIYVLLTKPPVSPSTMRFWYAVDSIADGSGGNPNDKGVSLQAISATLYKATISESELVQGKYVSFLFEIDGFYFDSNYTYLLKDLYTQDVYETIILNNVVVDKPTSIKLPTKVKGKPGKIVVYSIAGDIVKHVFEGTPGDLVYSWDGIDDDGIRVKEGMYFIVIDFADLKEVRKIYVK